MGPRPASLYVCQKCDAQSPKWMGRCPECGTWDSLLEELASPRKAPGLPSQKPATIVSLGELDQSQPDRIATGSEVLDRVLGGGLVPGGAVLLAGEPGIGKSTLLLQIADGLEEGNNSVLYVSAEESGRQLRMRAERIDCDPSRLKIAAETTLEPILDHVEKTDYAAILVDSVQAIRSGELQSQPGSISQVRHVAGRWVEHCKRREIALVLVGHITKEGSIAGPKSLEHLVDTVLSFEGDGAAEFRILRASKNRFGPAGEIAMYEMHDSGLREITDPSRVLLSRRQEETAGSAIASTLQGLRPLLVEVQALVHDTNFPSPRRMAVGCDPNRLVLLVAVLERFTGVSFANKDIFVNAVGGLMLREPAADLAIVAALVSALRDRAVPGQTVLIGEVGLLGEVRPVSRIEARLSAAENLGYGTAIVPKIERPLSPFELEIRSVSSLTDLMAALQL